MIFSLFCRRFAPTGLGKNGFQRAVGEIFARMGDGDMTGAVGMDKTLMTALPAIAYPAFLKQPSDNFFAVHAANYAHQIHTFPD